MIRHTFEAFGEGFIARSTPITGPRVLWIHGYTMSSAIWGDLWAQLPMWSHIGIDLPGHGMSPTPPDSQTLPDLARAIGRAAVEQRVEHVIGLSFGAIVSLQIGVEFPTAFRTITLAAASLTGCPDEIGARERYQELARLHAERGPGPWMTKTWMQRPPDIFTSVADHPKLWRDLADMIDRHSWSELDSGFMWRWVSHRQIDCIANLTHIKSAVLLIVGEKEMKTFRDSAESIRRHLDCSQIATIANAGHLCLLEMPDASSLIIEEHLSRYTKGVS